MRLLISSLLVGMMTLHAAAQNYSDAILGKWLSGDGDGKVEIYKSGNTYYGKITWLKEPYEENGKPKVDDENPDKAKRNQPIIGLVVLKDFKFKEGFWQDGTIYDPKNGKTYDCEMWLDGNNTLKIRGYWYFVYRTEDWKRTN